MPSDPARETDRQRRERLIVGGLAVTLAVIVIITGVVLMGPMTPVPGSGTWTMFALIFFAQFLIVALLLLTAVRVFAPGVPRDEDDA